MSCQTSRETDHGEGQHVEHNHSAPLTGHCRRLGAYIGRESFENLYSLIMPNYEVKYILAINCLFMFFNQLERRFHFLIGQ